MRRPSFIVIAVSLSASTAFTQTPAAQDVERTFRFTYARTPQALEQMRGLIRSTADIREVSIDAAQKALRVRAPAASADFAEWLFHELDQPPHTESAPSTREYRLPGSTDDVARVFRLADARTAQDLQELMTLLRMMGAAVRTFPYLEGRAVATRGNDWQVALVEWLIFELEKPAQPGQPAEYDIPGLEDGVVRIFYLPPGATVERLKEIATEFRITARLKRIASYITERAVAVRGTAEEVKAAEQLTQTVR
jgi:hypothetical protein